MFLLCRNVESESFGTRANVFRKQLITQNKESYNIARGHMGYRHMNIIIMICLHTFMVGGGGGGYLFFYFYCAEMSKQNQGPMCFEND